MKIEEIITSPRTFFISLNEEDPSLKWPALFITVMALLSAVIGYQMGALTGKLLSGMMQGIDQITAIFTAVSSFFGPYLMWIIAAVIFYAIQKFFKGTGSFKRVAEVTGYGMIPLILSSGIGLILAFYYLPRVEVGTIPASATDPDQINKAVQSMLLDPALHQYSLVISLISIILYIWSVNLWAFGFEACCGLDPKKAMITAGIPVLIYIVYTLAMLFIFTPGAMT